LPPHSRIAPTARMSDPGRNRGDGTPLGRLCLAIAGAGCDVFVLGV
jgi:hypothetical protein